jgi:hypothetical protein
MEATRPIGKRENRIYTILFVEVVIEIFGQQDIELDGSITLRQFSSSERSSFWEYKMDGSDSGSFSV